MTNEPNKGSHFFFTLPVCSLIGLIRPILKKDSQQGEAFAILSVEIDARIKTEGSNGKSLNGGDGSRDVPAEILHVTRKLLQRCLRANTDRLLPNADAANNHKLFFIVAYTQEQGVDIIARRIEMQLMNSEQLQAGDFRFKVSRSFLVPTAKEPDESMDCFAERAAAAIQDHMDTISRKESIQV